MRNRDGNCAFSFSIYAIIFFSSLNLWAKEYLISYRYVVKDAILYNESLIISRAMKKCSGEEQKTFIIDNYGSKNIKSLIHKNPNEFIDYIHKLGMDVQHEEITKNMQNSSTTILTLKTTCFKVDFNDTFAKMTPLK